MKVVVVAYHQGNILSPLNASVLTASQQFSKQCDVLIIGDKLGQMAQSLGEFPMVENVLVCDHKAYEHQLAENIAQVIHEVAQSYDIILGVSSTLMKDIFPRAAALLDIGLVSDVIEIKSKDHYKRPIYAGNAIANIKDTQKKKMLTIRATAFEKAQPSRDHKANIQSLSIHFEAQHSKFIKTEAPESSRPELTCADIVVSGGRGFGSKENFKQLETFADKLGAAIGASRAAVDAGYVPNDYQVGQTGKIIAPQLYICFGISGAIQHLAGMKDSKVIIAINKDPDAPIFKIADYHYVGDLFEVLATFEKTFK
ncbi:MAG: electron transfer flavoprotein subunit alpha [Legionellales bacterium]|nr:electron transfer flavoprotein subunit alpha [Legionellales bacterium]